MARKSFVFVVLAFNHEDFIIEHLESIKYIIVEYGSNIDVSLVISDDFSSDNTVALIDQWLDCNFDIFADVKKIFNSQNIGTCSCVYKALSFSKADGIKITAGDDVYSFENIFNYAFLDSDTAMVGGYPLALVDGVLSINFFDFFTITASDVIYGGAASERRFKLISNNNAPNIIYNSQGLKDPSVLDYLQSHDVIEDWPIQIALSRFFKDGYFSQISKVFVYYRRTIGSTYIVANNRFIEDKVSIFKYLISMEKCFFYRLILRSRLFSFLNNDKFYHKLFNLSYFHFSFMVFLNFMGISRKLINNKTPISQHIVHYNRIKYRAREFLNHSSSNF